MRLLLFAKAFVSVDKNHHVCKMGGIIVTHTIETHSEIMFGKMLELGSLMKHAREFGGRVQEMNERLKDLRIEGHAAGGLVTVSVNGLQELVSCKIDPGLFQQGDAELLEELIVNAVNDAVEHSRTQQAETMKSLTEGVDMGSLSGIIEKFVK
jgi:DNA-binding YbaB/EbfC family protein